MSKLNHNRIRIATRQSPLALWQAEHVKRLCLQQDPNIEIQLVKITTHADRVLDKALQAMGGKSLFCKELQQALIDQRADLAVHSIKDMSAQPHPYLTLAAVLERGDVRDAFVSNHYDFYHQLPSGATVGTNSPRRKGLLQAIRQDINVQMLRGNVGTRLQKLDDRHYDAIVLAAAGLNRLQLTHRIKHYFDPKEFVPAIAQGAIGIECRHDDQALLTFLQPLDHTPSRQCIRAERAVIRALNGDCFTPIGAHATLHQNRLRLNAMVSNRDGSRLLSANLQGDPQQAEQLGLAIATNLIDQGALALFQ